MIPYVSLRISLQLWMEVFDFLYPLLPADEIADHLQDPDDTGHLIAVRSLIDDGF